MSGEAGTAKMIRAVLPTPSPHWVGDGFLVQPLFGGLAFTEIPSPFLMFDWAAERVFPPSDVPRGVGPHPHRGFETVTIVYAGEVEHRDSAGHSGKIGPGDVQWMTAGRGVLHEEMHSMAVTRTGGTVSMAQIWVNLPAAHKMTEPRYQAILAADIPSLRFDGVVVRVVAGTLTDPNGTEHTGPASTHSPLAVWDIRLEPGSRLKLPIPAGWRTSVASLAGTVEIGGAPVRGAAVAIVSDEGGDLVIGSEGGAHVLVLTGAPIEEPIAHHGPFVMNTRAELQRAFEDYRAGAMGWMEGM